MAEHGDTDLQSECRGSDSAISSRGWTIETLKELIEVRLAAFKELDVERGRALRLQHEEYQRRLVALNGEAGRIREAHELSVSAEKFEDYTNAQATAQNERENRDKEALAAALLRINEKFDDYVLRYEQRQREVDQALALQEGAAQESKRITELEAQRTQHRIEEASRKTNRNMAALAMLLTITIAAANYLGTL